MATLTSYYVLAASDRNHHRAQRVSLLNSAAVGGRSTLESPSPLTEAVLPTMTEHPRSLAPRTFSTEHTTLERVLSSLRLERFAACGVYEDLEAVLGPYAQPEDAELVAVSLAQVLDHLLIRVRTPALAGRCPAAVVDRACATRVRCAAAGGEAGPGPVRLMALAVLDLLNLVGDDL